MTFSGQIECKTADQLKLMRKAGLIVAEGLQAMIAVAKPGVTTKELDHVAAEILKQHNAKSNFLNYGAEYGVGFPGVACISVNDEVVHGIPGERVLAEGDVLSVDFGAIYEGWHGDAARTVIVGSGQKSDNELVRATEEATWKGIAAAQIGRRIGYISNAIESYVKTLPTYYGIVREYTGHGIGTRMHMDPDVPNYGKKIRGPKIFSGMAIAIEPMLVSGKEQVQVSADTWTVVTVDGSRGAHWENTIAITDYGIWVLTEPDGGESQLKRLGVPFGPLSD